MFGILQEFVRGKFSYHLCSEFYRNLLEGSLVTINASKHNVLLHAVKSSKWGIQNKPPTRHQSVKKCVPDEQTVHL
jgi:hypothetical protein